MEGGIWGINNIQNIKYIGLHLPQELAEVVIIEFHFINLVGFLWVQGKSKREEGNGMGMDIDNPLRLN